MVHAYDKYAISVLKRYDYPQSIEELEKDMLNGQKLQGTTTAKEVYEFLKARNMTEDFPLMTTVYRIIYEGEPPETIVRDI
jgi:glycerol-3-phosphate dehydrogenase (NAD+)